MKMGVSDEIMKRFEERRQNYSNAVDRLQEGLQAEESQLIIDGILHRFEFTFELAWKTLKDYLEYMGYLEKTGSPRETIQNAFKQGIIEDGEAWINMMLARNSLAHLYDEEESRKVYKKIKEEYIILLQDIKEKFEHLL